MRVTRAVSLHGTTIAWSLEDGARDPLADLFALLDEADPANARIRFVLRGASGALSSDPRDEGWEPSFFHGIVQAYRGARGFLLWDRASRVLVPSDATDGSAIEAIVAPAGAEPAQGSAGASLQIAIALALRQVRLFHLHAAALILPSGPQVLIAGGSGAGKTTVTIALLERGAQYLGDDTLFLSDAIAERAAQDAIHVVAFPREFHLGAATLAMAPRLDSFAGALNARGDKRPVDPRAAYPGRHVSHFTLRAPAIALFPSVGREPITTITPLPRAEAFGHLLGSSAALVIEGLSGHRENFALLERILAATRCYEIRLGADALADPDGAIAARVGALAHAA